MTQFKLGGKAHLSRVSFCPTGSATHVARRQNEHLRSNAPTQKERLTSNAPTQNEVLTSNAPTQIDISEAHVFVTHGQHEIRQFAMNNDVWHVPIIVVFLTAGQCYRKRNSDTTCVCRAPLTFTPPPPPHQN